MRLATGTQVGPYEILGPLGAGGMGEVYRARDPRLDRDVAIKVLRVHLAGDPEAVLRFEREARAAASLSHPNVVSVHDFGIHDDSRFIVTELLEGETLRERLDRAPLPWGEAVEIGAAIADGITGAHDRDLIHRDLKPENVFLTSDGRVKVLDFGLATIRAPTEWGSAGEQPTLTHSGAVLGTVGYMSPEQVRGEPAHAASDVFSLGCILYEMVTGKRAFARETDVQTLGAILEEEPPAPSVSKPGLPAELDRLLSDCLRKDPEQREITARQILSRLKRLSGEKAMPSSGGAPGVPRRPVLHVSLAIAFLVAVSIAFVMGSEGWFGNPQDGAFESIAVLPFENLSGDPNQEYVADGITDALITDLGTAPELRVIARPAVLKYKGAAVDPRRVARELDVEALVAGTLRGSADRLSVSIQIIDPETGRNVWSESYDRDLSGVAALRADISRDIAVALNPDVGGTMTSRTAMDRTVDSDAYQDYLRAVYLMGTGTTDERSREAIAQLQEAIQKEPGFARAHAALARAYINRRTDIEPESADELEQRAFAALERALSLDADLADAYLARGELLWTHSHRFAHERAAREYRRALELNPSLDGAHEGLARIFAHVGFFEEALQHAQRALDLNPSNGIAIHHQSEALLWMGKTVEAMRVLRGIPEPVFKQLVNAHIAWAYSRLGRQAEAEDHLRQALRDYPDDPNGVLTALQAMFLADSQPKEAEKLIAQAAQRVGFNPSHHTAYFIGCAWARMGRTEEAVRHLREASATGFPCYPLMASDPNLDPIRDDAEFGMLLEETDDDFRTLRASLFPRG